MTLSDISIKNPVFGWMLMIGIIVFGWISYERLGVSQLPDVDFPVISVNVTWEGAAPEIVETEVTDFIENAVMSVEGIKEVTSVSYLGRAQISIEFNLSRNIDVALQEVQSKIAQVQRNLPKDIDPPVVSKTNPEDQPIMWVALSGDVPYTQMTKYVSDILKDRFTTVSGVGDVRLGGYLDPNLRVWLDAGKMKSNDLTVEDVLNAIDNQHTDLPAGYIDQGPKEINVRVYGEAATPRDFENILITSRVREGAVWKPYRIGDVGTVQAGTADVRNISRSWGNRAIGLGIIKQRGTNAVDVAKAVRARMKEMEKILPKGMHLGLVFDTTQFIKDSVNELKFNLLMSILLTSVVCFLFLGSWTATVNVLLAIPTSVMGAFLVLYFLGFTINVFTMLGLSLVIGIVVDDAIMVLENISRYQEMGRPRIEAAIVGAREITFAALAASIAILAIFVPVIFMQGIVGKFFLQYGVTISVAVAFSLMEALTITPMRCSQFLDVGHKTKIGGAVEKSLQALSGWYRSNLSFCLDHRKWVILCATAIFVSSLFLTKVLKKEFVPSQDQSRFLARVTLPLGSSLEQSDAVASKMEEFLMRQPAVQNYYCSVGGFGGSQINSVMLFITMKDKKDRPMQNGHKMTQQDFMQIVRKKFNSVEGVQRAAIQDLSQSGFTAQRGFPVEFTIRGPDWDKLGALSKDMIKAMKDSGLMTDVDTDYQPGMPELQVFPDREKAGQRGVSVYSIANTINATIGGVRNGKFTSDGKRYDVRVRLAEADRSHPKDVGKIWVRNDHGEVVALSEVTTSKVDSALFSITRKNRERAITIYGNPAPGHSQQEALDAVNGIAGKILPDGYRAVFSGGSQAFKESFDGLKFALLLGIFVAYMVLASQFNSFIHPLTVLLALPFSITGAFVALYLSHSSINMYSMIGLVLLMGIVKKNSILLVDFTNVRRKEGKDVRSALLEACPIRLRPILMTSTAVVVAALPEAMALGPGSETMIPMAISIVGGVIVSTLLTLFVVPCAYMILSRLERPARTV